jgi:hypothetical protein
MSNRLLAAVVAAGIFAAPSIAAPPGVPDTRRSLTFTVLYQGGVWLSTAPGGITVARTEEEYSRFMQRLGYQGIPPKVEFQPEMVIRIVSATQADGRIETTRIYHKAGECVLEATQYNPGLDCLIIPDLVGIATVIATQKWPGSVVLDRTVVRVNCH